MADALRHGILIYNPVSGRQRAEQRVAVVRHDLRAAGFDVAPRPTAGPGDATRIALAVTRGHGLDAGAEVVFALGGDGTLRETAAGLLGSDVPLGFLPAGTVNVMTLALGLPSRLRAAARLAGHLEARQVDVGHCGEHMFLMMASCGLDAEVMARQNPARKRFWGRAAVAATAVGTWWRYTYPPIEIESDGKTERATLVAVCNIPFYGGGFRLAPAADFADGALDLVLFRGVSRVSALALARDVALRRHLGRADITVRRIQHATLTVPAHGALQVDGDAMDHASARLTRPRVFRIEVVPRCLRLLMRPGTPSKW